LSSIDGGRGRKLTHRVASGLRHNSKSIPTLIHTFPSILPNFLSNLCGNIPPIVIRNRHQEQAFTIARRRPLTTNLVFLKGNPYILKRDFVRALPSKQIGTLEVLVALFGPITQELHK
jgi:hypothetical protein